MARSFLEFLKYTNNAVTTLNGGISDSTTTIVVDNGDVFPTEDFRITIYDPTYQSPTEDPDHEIIEIESRSGDTLTVAASGRGVEGTVAIAHSDGDRIILAWTKEGIEEIQDAIADKLYQRFSVNASPPTEETDKGFVYVKTDNKIYYKSEAGTEYDLTTAVINDSGTTTSDLWSASKITAELATKAASSHTHTASAITDFAEAVDDRVAALFVAGTNVTITYDDVANTLTIAASGGGGGISNVVEDTTPQLGGALDVNGFSIVSAGNGNITLDPAGTGDLVGYGQDVYFEGSTSASLIADTGDVFISAGNDIGLYATGEIILSAGSSQLIQLNAGLGVEFLGYMYGGPYYLAGSSSSGSGTIGINWTQRNVYRRTLTGNTTFTFTAPTLSTWLYVLITQNATGGYTVTWPASVVWDGTTPTVNASANADTAFTFFYHSTTGKYYGMKMAAGGGGSGEANTVTNIGTAGVGVFKQKTGVNFEFKNINAGSNKISVTDDTTDNEIDIDVVEANIVHQNLSGAGTNTHSQIDTHIAATDAHGATGAVAGTTNTQTLENKSLVDSTTYIIDEADNTKKIQFQASAIATGTTKVFTFPNLTGTVAILGHTQTWTGIQTYGDGLLKATSPWITTSVDDANGNPIIGLTPTASAVNYVNITNAATGGDPLVSAAGSDTNIDLLLKAKGSGTVKIGTAELAFPNTDGTNGQFLQTNGSGVLSWASVSGGGDMLASTYDPDTNGIIAIAQGGTNASTASGARTNLGLAIGSDVQAWDADLDTWATKTAPSGTVVGTSDTQTLTNKTFDASSNTLSNITTSMFAANVIDTDGTLAANSNTRIASQAAVKTYVDTVQSASDYKNSVKAATTANITLSGTQTIDGQSIGVGDRVLVKNQSTGSQNGIYVAASGAWSRSTDADSDADVTAGMLVFVSQGTNNGNKTYILTTDDPITLGSTSLVFTQSSGAGQITAGSGLSKSSDTLSVVVDDLTIEISSNALRVKAGSINLTSHVTGVLPIANGGTNASTAATAFSNIKQAASDTATGVVELAIASEVTTGTDTTRAITPDALSGSDYGKRIITIILKDDTTDLAVADGVGDIVWFVPQELNGWVLVGAHAAVEVAGTTGTTDIQIHNVTDGVDILSTKITIDSTERTSYTAAVAPVINTANDDLATGDRIRFDVDAVSTTAPKGLQIILTAQLP